MEKIRANFDWLTMALFGATVLISIIIEVAHEPTVDGAGFILLIGVLALGHISELLTILATPLEESIVARIAFFLGFALFADSNIAERRWQRDRTEKLCSTRIGNDE